MATALPNPVRHYHWDDQEDEFLDEEDKPVDKHSLLLLLLLLIGFGKAKARRVSQQYIIRSNHD